MNQPAYFGIVNPPRFVTLRRAFTLIELMIALAISSLLVMALASVISISMRTLNAHQGNAAQTSDTFELASQITSDLKLALSFTEQTSESATFQVPDRDGDQLPETIRYQWLPAPDNQLLKTIVFSDASSEPEAFVVAENLSSFDLEYIDETRGIDQEESIEEASLSLVYFNDDVPQETTAASRLLLVTADSGLSSTEQDRVDLFQSFGFTVSTTSAGTSNFIFSLWLSASDLVYVSAEVDIADLGNKLDDTDVAVVSENVGTMERFGFGIPQSAAQNRKIGFVSGDPHFITTQFQAGAFALFDTLQMTTSIDDREAFHAPGLTEIVRWADGTAFGVLNTGDEIYGASATDGTAGYTWRYSTEPNESALVQRQVATSISIGTASRIKSITASLHVTAATKIRYGIYTDYQGGPGVLLAETNETDVVANGSASWVTIELPNPVKVPTGDYWLSIGFKDDATFRYQTGLFASGSTRWASPGTNPTEGLMNYWQNEYDETRKASIYCDLTILPVSPGRRIQLPWTNSNFDVTTLNENAKDLLANSLQWAGDKTPNLQTVDVEVSADETVIEAFGPDNLPNNIDRWSVGPTNIRIRRNPDNTTGSVQFSLYLADENDEPVGDPLTQSALIDTSQFVEHDHFFWYEIPWSRTDWIAGDNRVCLVVTGTSAEQADLFFGYDYDPVEGLLGMVIETVLQLLGNGQTRSANANMYVYGTYQIDAASP